MNKAREYSSKAVQEILDRIKPEDRIITERKMLLAARIADAIIDKGWNKKNFAAALNKRPSEISKWLSGTHNFTIETLIEIEQVLGISLVVSEKETIPASRTYVYFASSRVTTQCDFNLINELNESDVVYSFQGKR